MKNDKCHKLTMGAGKKRVLLQVLIWLSVPLLSCLPFVPAAAGDLDYGNTSLPADSPDSNSFDKLNDYLKYAALNSPSVKGAFYDWQAAVAKTGYAGAMPDPVLSYGYFIENVETRVGPQEQRLSLKQSYPWFGTLGAKKDLALQSANAAFNRYQSEKLRLFYRVKAAYYNLYFLGREISLTRDNMELLTFWESIVRTKYKVALRQHPDLIKVQVELGKLEDKLASLEALAAPMAANLRAAIDLPDSVVIELPDEIETEESPVDHDSIFARAVIYNPDIISLQHLVEKERAGVRLAGKESWPGFTFGVDYIMTGEAMNPSLAESGKDPWIVSVGINLPVWFGKNKSRKQEAEAQLRSAQYRHIGARNSVVALTEKALFEYDDALRKIQLYRDGLLPKAEQSLNANYAAYQAGETDFLSILDAQQVLLDFQLKLEKAIVDLATSKAMLEMITGSEIDTDGTMRSTEGERHE